MVNEVVGDVLNIIAIRLQQEEEVFLDNVSKGIK
jgi:hypothetical protein